MEHPAFSLDSKRQGGAHAVEPTLPSSYLPFDDSVGSA